MSVPLVSVVIPARDEAQHLAACLTAVAAQDHPHDRLEVIVVVDGATRDGTAELGREALEHADFARTLVMVNAEGGIPGNLNVGMSRARGDVLCRVDARSRIPPDYVRRCAELLAGRPDVAVVGGAQVAVVPLDGARGAGIARALNNRWGMGWSRYRRDAPSGPSDTVYLGAFRADQLRDAGGWDSEMATNEDFELNRRLRRRGIVWYEAGLPVGYVPRASLRELYRQYRRFGRWKVRYWRRTRDAPRGRQLALLVGLPAGAALVALALVLLHGLVLVGVVASVVGGVLVVEVAGSRRPRGGPAVHGWSTAALGAVGFGWLRGAWTELLTGGGRDRG